VVESRLPKPLVAGSIPVSRSTSLVLTAQNAARVTPGVGRRTYTGMMTALRAGAIECHRAKPKVTLSSPPLIACGRCDN
jgi:hypothetical protein